MASLACAPSGNAGCRVESTQRSAFIGQQLPATCAAAAAEPARGTRRQRRVAATSSSPSSSAAAPQKGLKSSAPPSSHTPHSSPPHALPQTAPQHQGIIANAPPSRDAAASGGSCPFHALSTAVNAVATGMDRSAGPTELAPKSVEGKSIPGPDPWDVIGNLKDLSAIATKGIEEATLFYGQKYGSICRFSNGVTAWTFVNDADIIQHICSTNTKNYSLRFLPAVYEHVTGGRGILGSQGEYNRIHRKICQPPFMKPSLLAGFSHTIASQLQELVQVWNKAVQDSRAAGRGQLEADMALHLQRFTLDVIGLVAFSRGFGQLQRIQEDPTGSESSADAGSDKLLLAVNDSQQLMANVFITPLPVLRLLHWLREPGMMKLDASLEAMKEVMMQVIQDRRDVLEATDKAGEDLLGALLQAKDENGNLLTNEELWEDVHDVMGAGHETTATTMTASLFNISQHPEVLEKVLQEIDAELEGRAPTFDDVLSGKLAYTQMAVKETLRMYPPIPLFPRQVANDDWLPGGYKVPRGDVVFMSTYAMGRNERYWPEPLKFKPERFLPEEEAARPKFAWVPFGAGPRMCLGANFAVLAVTQVVATLLQNFRFEAVQPSGQELAFAYDITMNFPGGVRMKIQPRRG